MVLRDGSDKIQSLYFAAGISSMLKLYKIFPEQCSDRKEVEKNSKIVYGIYNSEIPFQLLPTKT